MTRTNRCPYCGGTYANTPSEPLVSPLLKGQVTCRGISVEDMIAAARAVLADYDSIYYGEVSPENIERLRACLRNCEP